MNNIRERNWRQARSRIVSFSSRNQRAGAFSLHQAAPLETDDSFGQSATVAYTAAQRDPQGMAHPLRDRDEEE